MNQEVINICNRIFEIYDFDNQMKNQVYQTILNLSEEERKDILRALLKYKTSRQDKMKDLLSFLSKTKMNIEEIKEKKEFQTDSEKLLSNL